MGIWSFHGDTPQGLEGGQNFCKMAILGKLTYYYQARMNVQTTEVPQHNTERDWWYVVMAYVRFGLWVLVQDPKVVVEGEPACSSRQVDVVSIFPRYLTT